MNNRLAQNADVTDFKSNIISPITTSNSSIPTECSTFSLSTVPLKEKTNNLSKEETELRKAPWFQAGISR